MYVISIGFFWCIERPATWQPSLSHAHTSASRGGWRESSAPFSLDLQLTGAHLLILVDELTGPCVHIAPWDTREGQGKVTWGATITDLPLSCRQTRGSHNRQGLCPLPWTLRYLSVLNVTICQKPNRGYTYLEAMPLFSLSIISFTFFCLHYCWIPSVMDRARYIADTQ